MIEQSWNLDFSVWDLTSSSGEQIETNEKYLLGPNTMKKGFRNTDEGMYISSGVKGSRDDPVGPGHGQQSSLMMTSPDPVNKKTLNLNIC